MDERGGGSLGNEGETLRNEGGGELRIADWRLRNTGPVRYQPDLGNEVNLIDKYYE